MSCLVSIVIQVSGPIEVRQTLEIVNYQKAKKLMKYIEKNQNEYVMIDGGNGEVEVGYDEIDIGITQDENIISAFKKLQKFSSHVYTLDFDTFYQDIIQ